MSEIQEGDPKWQRSPSSRSVKSLLSNNVSPNVIDAQPSWLTPPKHTFTDLESPDGSSVSKSKRRSTVRVPVESESNDTCCGCCPSDPVLYWFRIFHFISGFLGFASAAVNVYVMISNKSLGMVDLIIHAYTIMLCAAVVLAELDWRFFMAQVKILDSWIFRGLFYGFVGVLTISHESLSTLSLQTTPVLVVGITQAVFGVMYLLMGVACVKGIEQARSLHHASSARQQQYVEIPDGVTSPAAAASRR